MPRNDVPGVPSAAAAIPRRSSPRAGLLAVPGLAREAIDALVALFTSQLELTRAELRADARAAGHHALRLVIFVPILTIGYCLVLVALMTLLAPLTGWAPLLAGAGILHVAAGIVGLRHASRRLGEVQFLDRAGAELEKSVDEVSAAIAAPRPAAPSLPSPRPSTPNGEPHAPRDRRPG